MLKATNYVYQIQDDLAIGIDRLQGRCEPYCFWGVGVSVD